MLLKYQTAYDTHKGQTNSTRIVKNSHATNINLLLDPYNP